MTVFLTHFPEINALHVTRVYATKGERKVDSLADAKMNMGFWCWAYMSLTRQKFKYGPLNRNHTYWKEARVLIFHGGQNDWVYIKCRSNKEAARIRDEIKSEVDRVCAPWTEGT